MALQDINLIPETEAAGKAVKTRTKVIVSVTAAVLVIYVLAVGFIFLRVVQAGSNLSTIRRQKEPIQKDIDGQVTTEKALRALVFKLDAIDVVYKNEPPFEKMVSRLIELAGTTVSFTEVSLNAPDKVLISGTVANLDGLDGFLGTLTAKEFGRTSFSDIVLQSLSRTETGGYDFSLRFSYIGKP